MSYDNPVTSAIRAPAEPARRAPWGALLLITGSRLGDIVGRKRTFLLGLAGFVTASALVAVAQTPGMLIGFRALQGAAAALMLPQVLTFIQAEFDPEPRRAAFAVYGMMLALAGASGPLLGGVLIQANLAGWGWRTIFLVNVPIGVTALVLGSRRIPASRARQDSHLDPAGTALITLALLAVFYPLIEGRQLGWPAGRSHASAFRPRCSRHLPPWR